MSEHFITYNQFAIADGTATLASASAALGEAQTDLVNINSLLADSMQGRYHAHYQERMTQIEQPLMHLAQTVGVHGHVLDSITEDAVMLDNMLGGGG